MVRRKRGRANLEPRGSPGANKFTGEKMGFKAEYGDLLDQIAQEADAIALRYFRADELRVDRKGDGTAVTQAGPAVEEMEPAKVAAYAVSPCLLSDKIDAPPAT